MLRIPTTLPLLALFILLFYLIHHLSILTHTLHIYDLLLSEYETYQPSYSLSYSPKPPHRNSYAYAYPSSRIVANTNLNSHPDPISHPHWPSNSDNAAEPDTESDPSPSPYLSSEPSLLSSALLIQSTTDPTISASRKWTPLTLSECTFNTPSYFAPCLARRMNEGYRREWERESQSEREGDRGNEKSRGRREGSGGNGNSNSNAPIIYAEELVYPDFELREPVFASRSTINSSSTSSLTSESLDAPSESERQRKLWRSLVAGADDVKSRAVVLGNGWVAYRGQSGQNFVFANASYTADQRSYDAWSPEACMSEEVSASSIQPWPSSYISSPQSSSASPSSSDDSDSDGNNDDHNDLGSPAPAPAPAPAPSLTYPTLMIASSPDSWSFQHHLDRVTHIAIQGAHLAVGVGLARTGSSGSVSENADFNAFANKDKDKDKDRVRGRGRSRNRSRSRASPPTPTPYILTGRPGSPFVHELWHRLGFDDEHVLYAKEGRTDAERVVFSCRAVLVHPWISLRNKEVFGLVHEREPQTKKGDAEAEGMSEKTKTRRNKVMYMSRSNGHAHNGGRRILNEDTLISSMQAFLDTRGREEEVVIFDETSFQNADQLFRYFQDQVVAVVGPHGGAMYHHRWARKGTIVLEIMPTTFTSMAIYEEASVLSQNYGVVLVEPVESGGTDMEVDVEGVVGVLREHLDRALSPVGDGDGEDEEPVRGSYHWRGKEILDIDASGGRGRTR